MKKYLYQKRSVLLNITPLIDILFVIVIFFSLGTQISNSKQIPLVLPESDSAEQLAQTKSLKIVIDANNIVYINDQKLTIDEIEQVIVSQNFNREMTTELIIDKSVPHGFIIKILDILRNNRFTKISFLTREKS